MPLSHLRMGAGRELRLQLVISYRPGDEAGRFEFGDEEKVKS